MIEYLAPSSGGGGLQYPLKQITHTIDQGILKSLNSSPFALLTTGFNYIVISAVLNYDCVNVNSGQNYYIGYESLLGGTPFSSFCDFDTSLMGTNAGVIGLGTRTRNLWIANSTNIENLILWQQTDDGTAAFNRFDLTITYLEFP